MRNIDDFQIADDFMSGIDRKAPEKSRNYLVSYSQHTIFDTINIGVEGETIPTTNKLRKSPKR